MAAKEIQMDINLVHPELRKATASFPKLPVGSNFGRKLTRLLLPLLLPKTKVPEGVTIEWVKAATGQRLRVYTPAGTKTRPAMLYIHGGGMMIGAPQMDDGLLSNLASELDILIVSPEYRLAPEHPYPAPVDDCHEAWQWMLANSSKLGIDSSRIAIGGESAGGGLAAGLVLRIHDEGGQRPIAQWLLCPMLDDRTAQDRTLDGVDHFIWNNKLNLAGWSSYLSTKFGTEQVPAYAAPSRRSDFNGLPKAWIGVGDVELFYQEDKKYAENLKAAGVSCELDVVAGGPHAFEGMVPEAEVSKDYLARAKAWLGKALNL
jgi:acetyl esterase/lipase